jgi:hypothetical protein
VAEGVAAVDGKPWYLSKTIWGAVVAALSIGLGLWRHLTMSPQDQASLVDVIVGIAGSMGSVVAIYGRVTATTSINSSSQNVPPQA